MKHKRKDKELRERSKTGIFHDTVIKYSNIPVPMKPIPCMVYFNIYIYFSQRVHMNTTAGRYTVH